MRESYSILPEDHDSIILDLCRSVHRQMCLYLHQPALRNACGSDASIEVLDATEICYASLIEALSQEPYFPSSLQIRNALLAPFACNPPHPQLTPTHDPWQTFFDCKPGTYIHAFGSPPNYIRKHKKHIHSTNSIQMGHLWGLIIVYMNHEVGWIHPKDKFLESPTRWNDMHLQLWLSSERANQTENITLEAIQEPSAADILLLEFVFAQHIPTVLKHVSRTEKKHQIRRQENGHSILGLFAVNHMWVRILEQCSAEGKSSLQIQRSNPCMAFMISEKNAMKLYENLPKLSRWRVESLNESVEDATLVSETLFLPDILLI